MVRTVLDISYLSGGGLELPGRHDIVSLLHRRQLNGFLFVYFSAAKSSFLATLRLHTASGDGLHHIDFVA